MFPNNDPENGNAIFRKGGKCPIHVRGLSQITFAVRVGR